MDGFEMDYYIYFNGKNDGLKAKDFLNRFYFTHEPKSYKNNKIMEFNHKKSIRYVIELEYALASRPLLTHRFRRVSTTEYQTEENLKKIKQIQTNPKQKFNSIRE